ncbi:hypothetical protein PDJAM_G00090690, partial [Pangasius djambal]|nr:hypothetical protein [Pangasius djambal]
LHCPKRSNLQRCRSEQLSWHSLALQRLILVVARIFLLLFCCITVNMSLFLITFSKSSTAAICRRSSYSTHPRLAQITVITLASSAIINYTY